MVGTSPTIVTEIEACRAARLSARLFGDRKHPLDPEFVLQHAEARREKGLDQRLSHLAAFRQRVELLLAVAFVFSRDRQRKALEFWLSLRPAVGTEHGRVAELEFCMHYLFRGSFHAPLLRTFAEA